MRNVLSQAFIRSKVAVDPASGCWIWQAYKQTLGYGQFCLGGKRVLAHRASYTVFVGPIPKSLFVLHNCDTPACVNPEHLFLGDAAANRLDAIAKGRMSADFPIAAKRKPRVRKLTHSQVMAIYASTGPLKPTADQYGVTIGCISLIRRGKRKAKLTQPIDM